MATNNVSAARETTAAGEEFLMITIPPEHYANETIWDRYFEFLGHLNLPLVVVSATRPTEWSIRTTVPSLLAAMDYVKVKTQRWHRMAVTAAEVPQEL